MTRNVLRTALVACASVAATMATTSRANAANPLCSSLPSPIYVNGSSAVQPLIAELGDKLGTAATIVYKSQGSCLGPDAIVNGTKITGTAIYWTGSGPTMTSTCDLQDPNDANDMGRDVDVGVSDVYASGCNITPGADVGDFYGPNQVMNFIVPAASSVTAVSAEVAYMLYGFGAAGQVSGFDDDAFIVHRPPTSGTQVMIGAAIGVPATKWKGTEKKGSGDVLTAVSTSASPEKTIGILASDVADNKRADVHILAYQHWGQSKAYWPDSTSSSFDKRNVRDGHYAIWGPLHLFAKIDGSGVPTSPAAKQLVGWFTGTEALPMGADLLSVEIAAHTVPACAMHVSRSSEVGALACYASPDPCDCFFDKAATGTTTCATCAQSSDCTNGGTCRRGYCEAW